MATDDMFQSTKFVITRTMMINFLTHLEGNQIDICLSRKPEI